VCTIRPERTAIARPDPSTPLRWALARGHVGASVLDWGCGRGRDVHSLRSAGRTVWGYDPHYAPLPGLSAVPFAQIDTILLIYVLNVIAEPGDRQALLDSMAHLASPGTRIVAATRSRSDIERAVQTRGWRPVSDGYISRRETFQKGYDTPELCELCGCVGPTIDQAVLPGGPVVVVAASGGR
jgi:DNA phosphorothioation-associated putative methyltransferase